MRYRLSGENVLSDEALYLTSSGGWYPLPTIKETLEFASRIRGECII
ncbi:MAG: hypothetical protein AAF944_24060 [Bacteroidota bacterium]